MPYTIVWTTAQNTLSLLLDMSETWNMNFRNQLKIKWHFTGWILRELLQNQNRAQYLREPVKMQENKEFLKHQRNLVISKWCIQTTLLIRTPKALNLMEVLANPQKTSLHQILYFVRTELWCSEQSLHAKKFIARTLKESTVCKVHRDFC